VRAIRRIVQALTGLLVLLGAAVVAGVLALHAPAVQDAVRARLVALLAEATGARVALGRVRLGLPLGIRAADVRLVFPAGARVAARELSGSLAIPGLLAGRIDLGTVRVRGLRARLVPTASNWGFDDLGEAEPPSGETALPSLRIARIVVTEGRIVIPPWRLALDEATLDAALAMDPDRVQVSVESLTGMPRGIAVSPLVARGSVTVTANGEEIGLDHVDLATRESHLTADGRVVFDRRLEGHVEAAPLAARELRALTTAIALRADVSGVLDARGPWRRITVRSALRTRDSGSLRLFGVLDAGGPHLPYRARARVRHLDLAVVDPVLAATDITGRVRGRGALASLDEPPLTLHLGLTASHVAGTRLDGARIAARIGSTGIGAHGVIAAPAGRASIDGRLSWTGNEPYQARVRARLDDLARLVPGVSGRGHLTATIDGSGLAAPRRAATIRARLARGQLEGVAIDAASADLRLRGTVLALDSGSLVGAGLRASASGTLDLERRSLEMSARAAGALAGAAGTVDLRAAAHGSLGALAVQASGRAEQLRAGTIAIDRASFSASLADVGSDTPAGHASADVAGLRPGTGPPWTGNVVVDWARSAGVDTGAASLHGRAEDGAQLGARATMRRSPTGDTTLELAELRFAPADHPAWTLAHPATVGVQRDLVTIDRLDLAAGAQRVSAGGRIGLIGAAEATLAWQDVELEPLCRLRGLACTGSTTGSARLTGDAAAPHIALTAQGGSVAVEGSPAAAIAVTGDYGDRALVLHGTVTQPDAGRLQAAGRFPVDLAWHGPRRDLRAAPIELTVQTDGLDLTILRLVAPEAIREIDGRLVADLELSGPWDDLRASGTLDVRAGRLALGATGAVYQDVEISAAARGRTIEFTTIRARGGNGTLEGGGTMALTAAATAPFAIELRFADFEAVSLPAVEAATDGTLTVEGTLAYPVVRGELVLTHLVVRPSVLKEASGPSLEPDPTIEVVGLSAPQLETPTPAAPGVSESLSLDVAIRIDRDAWIRRTDADVELRGEIRLGKAAYHPLFVTGEIRLERGWYAFQGRRFEIDEGRIVFGGDVPPDPQLDITALNKTGGYEVTVRITGRASEPALALSSSPPLEQADILSLLVFGRPARDLGRQQSLDLQKQAISLASGYVMPELRQSVLDTLGLDTFEAGAEGVRAGRYVTRDVFITLSQDFTGRAGQTVGVEYSVTRRLTLKLSTSTQGTSAVDMLWRRRY
jgi:translocation and assembly module TamB